MVLIFFIRSYHHCVTKLFQPLSVIPKDAHLKKHELLSKSQKLMLELGIIRTASPGCFHYLPLAVKALEKLIKLIDSEMKQCGGQKIILPTLTNTKLWQCSGRLEEVTSELFTVKDRHNQDYILSPTHEEAVSDLIASISPVTYKAFPMRLYQITSKYRDEMKPRFGLLRSKQFLMKDMYSFDIDVASAKRSYEEISLAYNRIFSKIGVGFVKVMGSTGHIGGTISHEYHYTTNIGEDKILICNDCNYSANAEITDHQKCLNCGSQNITFHAGIEVGHTFLLEDKYSKPLKATYLSSNGKPEILQMGCYGLGVSRIMAAALETLSTENELRWPKILSPYSIVMIPPKKGSKEEKQLKSPKIVDELYMKLEAAIDGLKDNILIDDRIFLTIGKRILDSKRVGYPFIIILGHKIIESEPLFELIDVNSEQQLFLNEIELVNYFKEHLLL